MKRDILFRDLDKAAQEAVPPSHQVVRDYLLQSSGWTGSDGDIPGYFRNKPQGHRCLWSCNWSTRMGFCTPDVIWGVDAMTSRELALEGLDIAYTMRRDVFVADKVIPLVLDYFSENTSDIGDPAYWMQLIQDALRQARRSYQEYTFPGDPPSLQGGFLGGGRLMAVSHRPGWSQTIDNAAILQKAGVQ